MMVLERCTGCVVNMRASILNEIKNNKIFDFLLHFNPDFFNNIVIVENEDNSLILFDDIFQRTILIEDFGKYLTLYFNCRIVARFDYFPCGYKKNGESKFVWGVKL